MFGRFMNNYYYGKSGKGDFRKEDLPQNRRQLFTDTLKTRLSALCRINLLYMLIFLPMMIMLMYHFTNILSVTSNVMLIEQNDYASYVETLTEAEEEVRITEEQFEALKNDSNIIGDMLDSTVLRMLICLPVRLHLSVTFLPPISAGISPEGRAALRPPTLSTAPSVTSS